MALTPQEKLELHELQCMSATGEISGPEVAERIVELERKTDEYDGHLAFNARLNRERNRVL